MMPYAIGLDVGIASVGWATVGLDSFEKPFCILGMGSRVFTTAENPKDGSSLAKPRREARSTRRRLRRHRHRNERIRQLLLNEKLISEEELQDLFSGKLPDIYSLRVEGLERLLSNQEFARILLHIAQRRGFKSNRKNVTSKEDGELLKAVNENQERMTEKGYRTVAEMLLKDPLFAEHKRNKGGAYLTTVTRKMVEEEVRKIFASQRELGSSIASESFENQYLEIMLSQRSFDEGPGGNSPYGGDQIEKMIGKCTFFKEEPRAAKACYSFEIFTLLEKVSHISLYDESGVKYKLSDFQRKSIVELSKTVENLTYARIRKELKIPENLLFNMVRYGETAPNEVEKAEKKEKFAHLRAYHEIRKVFAKNALDISSCPREFLDAIGNAFTMYKTTEKIESFLRKENLPEEMIHVLVESDLNFTKFGHLSLKACRILIPELEKGSLYHEACEAAGISFKGHEGTQRSKLLHPTEDDYEPITSPVAKRAISQTIKIVNAIIRKQGDSPVYINIELAREMARNFDDRVKIEKEMEAHFKTNQAALERIRVEYGKANPSGMDLLKLRLYEEQDGVCAYSLKQIDFQHLFDHNYVEIDHIIPYSDSFDDSFKNKVLVFTKENRDKGNRLPLQYLEGEKREKFITWVNSKVRDSRKKKNLLKEEMTEEDRVQFKERNLQDTKTISRFLLNYLNDNLLFNESSKRKKRVTAVNGAITAYMRKRWGISKVREEGDKHHAVDALVIACVTDGMIKRISAYAKYRECEFWNTTESGKVYDPDTGELIRHFPYPWEKFHEDLAVWKERIFVSRMPNRKISGAAHKETIKSARALPEGKLVKRVELSALKLDKNGEIENYYRPELDYPLYEAIKERLIAYGGKGDKAFNEPFMKPGNDAKCVKKVRVFEKATLSVPVLEGTGRADNQSITRVDVYKNDDGYYLVPIYVADTLKPELPNKAVVQNKCYDDWKEMKGEDFIFSLYQNDLIRITHKKELSLTKRSKDADIPDTISGKTHFLYFQSMNISGGTISAISHDGAYSIQSLGCKTLEKIEKFEVNLLGEIHQIEKEKRLPFSSMNR